MCLGPVIENAHSTKEIIKNAVTIMTPREDGSYRKGTAGFSAWAKMLCDDTAFPTTNDAILFERMLCQDDATTCLIDGRGCAAEYFKRLSESETEAVSKETLEKYKTLSTLFAKTKALAEQTWSLLGGWDNMEQRPGKLAEREVREKACEYVKQIEALEKQNYTILQTLIEI